MIFIGCDNFDWIVCSDSDNITKMSCLMSFDFQGFRRTKTLGDKCLDEIFDDGEF